MKDRNALHNKVPLTVESKGTMSTKGPETIGSDFAGYPNASPTKDRNDHTLKKRNPLEIEVDSSTEKVVVEGVHTIMNYFGRLDKNSEPFVHTACYTE